MSEALLELPAWMRVTPRQPWAWQAGELELVDIADPAVAIDWTYTPQGGSWEELVYLHARLVTDANAANRTPTLTVADQRTRAVYEAPVIAAQAASLTIDYSWARDLGTTYPVIGGKVALALPRIILRPGWTVSVVTGAVQAGDQWSAVRATVLRYRDADPPQLAS